MRHLGGGLSGYVRWLCEVAMWDIWAEGYLVM